MSNITDASLIEVWWSELKVSTRRRSFVPYVFFLQGFCSHIDRSRLYCDYHCFYFVGHLRVVWEEFDFSTVDGHCGRWDAPDLASSATARALYKTYLCNDIHDARVRCHTQTTIFDCPIGTLHSMGSLSLWPWETHFIWQTMIAQAF